MSKKTPSEDRRPDFELRVQTSAQRHSLWCLWRLNVIMLYGNERCVLVDRFDLNSCTTTPTMTRFMNGINIANDMVVNGRGAGEREKNNMLL